MQRWWAIVLGGTLVLGVGIGAGYLVADEAMGQATTTGCGATEWP